MNLTSRFIVELVIVGFLNVVFGFIVSYVMMGQEKSASFNHWGVLLLSFFITGLIIHLFNEVSGFNDFYCKYKNKCPNN